MQNCNRRAFLKACAAGGCLLGSQAAAPANAYESPLSPDRQGILIDTTACVGCRHCEWACRNEHGLATDTPETYLDQGVFTNHRRPDENNLTVVNQVPSEGPGEKTAFVKVQCMHCERPACVSACIVGALKKAEDGSVTWDSGRCIGCRYCMIACPFQVPAFEYNKALQPDIVKCDFCHSRRQQGKLPACAEICPMEALLYGPWSELVTVARKRISRNPERYIDHIYGEKEVGSTSMLYLAGKDFTEKLRFPKLGKDPAPGVSEAIQHGIFAYFIPPLALYSILGGLMWITGGRHGGHALPAPEDSTEDSNLIQEPPVVELDEKTGDE